MAPPMNGAAPSFGIVDYIVFIGMFLVSIGIGVYFGFVGRRSQNPEQYLMGDRKLSLIPVALSITVSVVSTNTLLGAPAETYNNGFMYVFMAIPIILSTVTVAYFFVPVIFSLNIISINEYLERRFKSKSVRYLGCVLFLLNSALYVGTVIFGPATALTVATGAPAWASIIIVGVIGTGYTTIGGMKAVVWTDAFQSVVMVAGLIAVCILGAMEVGGITEVVKIANDWGRLKIDLGLNLTSRFGLLVMVIGYTNYWIAAYAINQPCSQRYCAMENQRKGRLAVLLNCPGYIILNCLSVLTGVVAFAYYSHKGCDPIEANLVSNANQIVPYFVMDILSYPGLPGIFVSSLFSAALSTLSSSINSMAAVTWEDFFKQRFHTMSQEKQALFTKCMVVIYGALCIIVSFLVLAVGGNLVQIALSFFGATIGPTLGLFVLGFLFPWANWKGALTGGVVGLSLSLWVMFGQVSAKLMRETLPSPTYNCWNTTEITYVTRTYNPKDMLLTSSATPDEGAQGVLHALYSVSFSWFCLASTLLVIVIGLIVSILTGGNDTENIDSSLLFKCLRNSYGKEMKYKEKNGFSNDFPVENIKKEEAIGLMDVTKT